MFVAENASYIYMALVAVIIFIFIGVFVVVKRSRHSDQPPAITGPETDEEQSQLLQPDLPEPEPLAGPETTLSQEPAEEAEPSAVTLDTPEPVASRLVRLRSRLAKSGSLGKALLSVLSRGDLSAADWEELEDTLLMADLGVEATEELLTSLREEMKVLGVNDSENASRLLKQKLLELVDPKLDRSLNLEKPLGEDGFEHSAAVLVVGVNGTGKTTTVGKLARILVAEGKSVILGAADTFRAAAAEQLATWGQRVGVEVVASEREGADPASVAFEAVRIANDSEKDVVLVDTAGRLQNKATLMDELGKVKRVMEREAPVTEVLLVLDATTGQNGMMQAKVFSEVVDVTGIVLTKLDGSAKGGIVVSVQRALGVPVKLVGLGEGPDDLAPFDPEAFVDALLEN